MTLAEIRAAYDNRLLALASELVNETVAVEGEPACRFQRVRDQLEADARVIAEADAAARRVLRENGRAA